MNNILDEAHHRHSLLPNESAALAKLPPNRQLLVQEFPHLADRIASGIRNQLDKHEIGGKTKITNDLAHFQDVETRWTKMESDIRDRKKEAQDLKKETQDLKKETQDLRSFQQDILREKEWMNQAELYTAIQTIRTQQNPYSKAFKPSPKTQAVAEVPEPQVEAVEVDTRAQFKNDAADQTETRTIRNRLAHDLNLEACLRLVEREPVFELAFDVLFGLPSKEAKALCQFDKTQSFHTNTILSDHARLWKLGLPDTFVNSYRQWLDAMRQLLSMQSRLEVDHALVSSAERLAEIGRASCRERV